MADIDVEAIIKKLTLAEKVDLLTGECLVHFFHPSLQPYGLMIAQALTSGTQSHSQSMEYHQFVFQMVPMVSGGLSSSMVFVLPVFPAERPWVRPLISLSLKKLVN